MCSQARHAHRCAVVGSYNDRTEALERVWARIHRECGHSVDTQVHVPQWDRWRWHYCARPACQQRGVAWTRPTGPCTACGSALSSTREEAILDLDVRTAEAPRTFYDVTVRYSVPAEGPRLRAAAGRDGAVAAEAEGDKRRRYPAGQTPWRAVPLVTETGGRLGKDALKHLLKLARKQAETNEEGGDAAVSSLLLKWASWLSVALHNANSAVVRSALGGSDLARHRGELLRETLSC